MSDTPIPASPQAWSQYWSAGRISSCPGPDDSNYHGEMAACWQDFFKLQPVRSRVLDIACGNGALLLLARQFAEQQQAQWLLHGVDRAAVQVIAQLRDADARMLSGIDMHELPYANGSFDVVCSQYGIEYGRFPDNLHEAMRVLKSGGSFQFIVHDADSTIAHRVQLQLQQIDLLQMQWQLFDKLHKMLETELTKDFSRMKQRFDEAAGAAFGYMRDAQRQAQDISLIEQTLQQLGGIWQLRGQHGLESSLTACAQAQLATQSLARRLLDQQQAMLDRQQVNDWLQFLRSYDAATSLQALHSGEHALGWVLRGDRI
ncbi:MAG: class I SAM-dependent methyltransferase [Gammaproteobacteria bacterium]|nr:class I SAM-dependent methyltransferase [Gammaproteobacteria bacterium]